MPVTYRIISHLHLVVTTWTGDVTLEESQQHNASLRDDPAFAPDMRQLSDARQARSRVTGDGIRGLARSSPFGRAAKRAILVADDETFGVSRMYEAQATDAGMVAIFRDRDAALAFLDLDHDRLPENGDGS